MNARTITADVSVSPQISPKDVQAIADQGFRGIICNRPDGESADQPAFKDIAKAAEAKGLATAYLPIASGTPRDEDAEAFERLMDELPGPILAYCRSGMRSATLWALAAAKTSPVTDILAATQAQGYDMSGLVARIADRGASDPHGASM